jgi:hypothetical protein
MVFLFSTTSAGLCRNSKSEALSPKQIQNLKLIRSRQSAEIKKYKIRGRCLIIFVCPFNDKEMNFND